MQLIAIIPPASKKILEFLWKELLRRDPKVSISHKQMPTWEQHWSFVDNQPYRTWYIIEHNGMWVGQIYLTYDNEIGVHICPEHQNKGFGRNAVQKLLASYGPGRYLANIAPTNPGSQDFFKRLGFKLIQYTYELET